jgi:hypothetical protein
MPNLASQSLVALTSMAELGAVFDDRKRQANRFCNRALVSHDGNLDLQKSHEHRSDLQFFALNQTSFADFVSIIHRA